MAAGGTQKQDKKSHWYNMGSMVALGICMVTAGVLAPLAGMAFHLGLLFTMFPLLTGIFLATAVLLDGVGSIMERKREAQTPQQQGQAPQKHGNSAERMPSQGQGHPSPSSAVVAGAAQGGYRGR